MAEPFFGTVTGSPIWSGLGSGFGFSPAPLGFGMSPGAELSGMSAFGQGFQVPGGIPNIPHSSFAPPGYGLGLMPQAPAPPMFPPGVTALGIISTIAMRRGQPQGPANDQDIEEFILDALELLPGTNDVDVRVEGGRVTLTGDVPQKRVKHDVGELAWTIPNINDVANNVNIAARRRARGSGREGESPQSRRQG